MAEIGYFSHNFSSYFLGVQRSDSRAVIRLCVQGLNCHVSFICPFVSSPFSIVLTNSTIFRKLHYRKFTKTGNARFSITGFSLQQEYFKISITPMLIFYTISFRQQKLHYKSTMSKSVICLFCQQAIFTPFEAKQCQTIRDQIRFLRVRSCLQHLPRSWSKVHR